MAHRIGIIGPPNTGKSYSRKFIKKGEEVFIIAPSNKLMYLTKSDGTPVKRLGIKIGDATIDKLGSSRKEVLHKMTVKTPPNAEITGNYDIVPNLSDVVTYLRFIDQCMPHIKVVIIPDITHFISNILANPSFITRKTGSEAYQRFWELAGDALNNIILESDLLRDDLIVVTEWHMEYDENEDLFHIFVPGGKMLTDKFKIDSYFDVMLYTLVEATDNEFVTADSYKFVLKKKGPLNARDAGLFEENIIPNNLQLVLDRLSAAAGLTD